MSRLPLLGLSIGSALCALLIAGCQNIIEPLSSFQETVVSHTPIQHVVVIMQENRTVDNLFNGFPGADTVQYAMNRNVRVPLAMHPLGNGPDIEHSHRLWWKQWDQGKMDGFGTAGSQEPFTYVNPADVQAYWTLAQRFTLGDRMFQANSGPSFPSHQYMIAGQSGEVSGNPSSGVWGCDAAAGTVAAVVAPNGAEGPGVFPCFDYPTMADLLDAKNITWRYYAPGQHQDGFYTLSAFQAIRHIRFGTDWHDNVVSPETTIFSDIANGHLAQVTWVIPSFNNSDHPGSPAYGPDWVSSLVNAIGESKFWNSTAIFIAWDDWGGYYDHVPPPQVDDMGLGFRVPLLVVSPYARHGYVSHVTHEISGVLRFTEEIFRLPSLNTRDAIADDFRDCFDFSQKPQPYTPVKTKLDARFFEAQAPSGPPDDD